jgi:hypothetical protein
MTRAGLRGWLDAAVVVVAALLATLRYLDAYRRHPQHPHLGGGLGWWTWFDQERYFNAAVAWAHGDLDPARHWYPPGYPLLAAPFVRLLSVHGFLLADLLCLLASLWLFSRLAGRLAPEVAHARALGAALFAAVSAGSPLVLNVWVVPWSSTGAVPLVYASLLAALHFIARPQRARYAFLTALAGGLVLAFRPTDTMTLLLPCAAGMAVAVLRHWPGWAALARGLAAGVAGMALALAAVAAAYLPVHGWHESPYIVSSGQIGFEWRLLPLHWVTLMLDPRPLLGSGQGLLEALPWMVAGVCGCAVFLLLPLRGAGRWAAHATVILAATLQLLVYLTYRDLHPDGIFRFGNYHYFKWVFPILAFYAALLAHRLASRAGQRLPVLAVALATAGLLLPWRAELAVTGAQADAAVAGEAQAVGFDSGLASVRDGLLVAATGAWGPIYFGPHRLTVAGRDYAPFADFRLFPYSGGFLLVPLRPLAAGPARLTLAAEVRPELARPPLHVRQRIVFGWPCWLPQRLYACAAADLIPPPTLPPDGVVAFDGSESGFLGGGWSDGDSGGRWTDGGRAVLRLRPAIAAPAYALTLDASAYLPGGAGPLDVRILANGRELLARRLATGDAVSLAAILPADALDPPASGSAVVTLVVANPRRPEDYDATSADARRLGLFVRRLSVQPLLPPS